MPAYEGQEEAILSEMAINERDDEIARLKLQISTLKDEKCELEEKVNRIQLALEILRRHLAPQM